MSAPHSALKTDLEMDDPVQLTAGYQLDATDRRFMDNQIRELQENAARNLRGQISTWFRLSGTSPSIAIGDVLVLSPIEGPSDESSDVKQVHYVTKASAATLAAAGCMVAIAVTPAAAGAIWVRGVVAGIIGPSITGLGSGAPGPVRVNPTTGRCERVATLATGSYGVGFADSVGNLTISATGLITVAAATGGTFNVTTYGAVGNGTTNDSAAIATAVAAAVAASGDVYFPPGIYLSDNIFITNANGVRLRGAGHKASIIKARNVGSVVTFTNCQGGFFDDLAIERADALFQTAGGYALAFYGCTRSGGSNLRISYSGAGILVSSCTRMHFRGQTLIERISAGGGAGFLRYEGTGAAPSSDCSFDKLVYDGAPYPVAPTTVKGNWATSTAYALGDIVINGDRYWICTSAGTSASSGSGPVNIPGTDGPSAYTTAVSDGAAQWKFLIGNSFGVNHDSDASELVIKNLDCVGAINNGVQMWKSGGTNNPQGLSIDRCRIIGAMSNAVSLVNGQRVRIVPTITTTYSGRGILCGASFLGGAEIIGGKIERCMLEGIVIGSTGGVRVIDTEVRDNSLQSTGLVAGISVVATAIAFRIIGCRSSGANQKYGIDVGAGCSEYVITDNDLTQNVTSVGLHDGSMNTALARKVRNNLGDDSDRASNYFTAQTATLAATDIFAAIPPKGLFAVQVYLASSGGTGGTAAVDISHTDDNGATTANVFSGVSLSGTVRKSGSIVIETDGVTMPRFSVTLTGATGSPNYSFRLTATLLTD